MSLSNRRISAKVISANQLFGRNGKVMLKSILFACLALMGCSYVLGQERTVTVAGRAIDERGKPIGKPLAILYYPPCRDCFEHLLESGLSEDDGVFWVDHTASSFQGVRLFIEERVPFGFWSPLRGGPHSTLARLPDYRIIPIRPKKGQTQVNLGDVLIKLRFGRVRIELPYVLRKYAPQRDEDQALNIKLRNKHGRLIFFGWVTKVAFDETSSLVNLALPRGVWKVEFFGKDPEGRLESQRLTLRIRDLGCKRITLNNGRQSERACT